MKAKNKMSMRLLFWNCDKKILVKLDIATFFVCQYCL